MKKRLTYFSLSCLCFLLCVLIVKLFSNNLFIRGFLGDVIVVLLIYFLVKAVYDMDALKLSVCTLAIAYLTECLQYIHITDYLGIGDNHIARLVFGSVFDPFDLLAYTIGAVLVYFLDVKLIRKAIIMDTKS